MSLMSGGGGSCVHRVLLTQCVGCACVQKNERRTLNYLVKGYLSAAGYKMTAVTFAEEVTDQVRVLHVACRSRGQMLESDGRVCVCVSVEVFIVWVSRRVVLYYRRIWMIPRQWVCTCVGRRSWAYTVTVSRRQVQRGVCVPVCLPLCAPVSLQPLLRDALLLWAAQLGAVLPALNVLW